MRKLIAIILAVMLIASMAISASAATVVPIGKTVSYKMPTIKTVDIPASTVYESAKVAIQKNIIGNLYKDYSFNY